MTPRFPSNARDILALFDALHDESRISEPATWRANLEAVFNVDTFIHWLAVNTVIQNWDTYGTMAHNYYLYNDPTTGLLTWIPWDNNEALTSGGGSGRRVRGALADEDLGSASAECMDGAGDASLWHGMSSWWRGVGGPRSTASGTACADGGW